MRRQFIALSEKDQEFANILTNLGIKKNAAKTLAYLAKVKKAISRDIEIGADLRQPEVSIAMKELKNMGWINEREIKTKGKGRPIKCYTLSIPLPKIVDSLEHKRASECEARREDVERLKQLVGELAGSKELECPEE